MSRSVFFSCAEDESRNKKRNTAKAFIPKNAASEIILRVLSYASFCPLFSSLFLKSTELFVLCFRRGSTNDRRLSKPVLQIKCDRFLNPGDVESDTDAYLGILGIVFTIVFDETVGTTSSLLGISILERSFNMCWVALVWFASSQN